MTDAPLSPAPPVPAAPPPAGGDSLRGLGFALSAYLMWGFLPLYMKALAAVPTLEVLAHRVVWSVPVAGLLLVVLRRTGDLRRALRRPRVLGMAVVTAGFLAVNWGVYVWSVQSGRALDAALGYYINPLVTVLVGRLVLGERLVALQWLAVGLAAAAVGVLTIEAGRLPLPALALAFSWATYAYFKKSLPVGPNQGFMLEVLVLTPAALGWIGWLHVTGQAAFLTGARDTALLLGTGLVTAVPLIVYANGARLLRLSTAGMLQYLVPTMILAIAVLLFNEPFGRAQALAFALIWAGMAAYVLALVRISRAG